MKNRAKHYHFNLQKKFGVEKMGLMSGKRWREDPKGTLFTLARYKFVSKLIAGKNDVLELGCGDGWYSRIVKQNVKNLTISDIDNIFIDDSKKREKIWKFNYLIHDMSKKVTKQKFDVIYMLDVFEHIPKNKEKKFIENLINSLKQGGILLSGAPSLSFQKFVKNPDPTHVNCKSGMATKKFFEKYFQNVFNFSMNDEIVHTGFEKTANYFISLCTNNYEKK